MSMKKQLRLPWPMEPLESERISDVAGEHTCCVRSLRKHRDLYVDNVRIHFNPVH